MRMCESQQRRRLVQCACKGTDHGLVLSDGQLLRLREATTPNVSTLHAALSIRRNRCSQRLSNSKIQGDVAVRHVASDALPAGRTGHRLRRRGRRSAGHWAPGAGRARGSKAARPNFGVAGLPERLRPQLLFCMSGSAEGTQGRGQAAHSVLVYSKNIHAASDICSVLSGCAFLQRAGRAATTDSAEEARLSHAGAIPQDPRCAAT